MPECPALCKGWALVKLLTLRSFLVLAAATLPQGHVRLFPAATRLTLHERSGTIADAEGSSALCQTNKEGRRGFHPIQA